MIKNETERGANPYSGGHEEVVADLVSRKRNFSKERSISPVPFSSTIRTESLSDVKMRV